MDQCVRNAALLSVLAFVFLMLGNGILPLTNPDEVFYTQTAREMVQHKSWMVPYLFDQPQFEKPILTYWLLRIGFLVFGETNFSVRFFPALFGMIGVLAVYLLARLGFRDEKKAVLSALVLMSGGLYIGLCRTVFTDMIFSVFILLALAAFYWAYAGSNRPRQKTGGLVLFYAFMGLAVLTKGPLGFLLPALAVVLFLVSRRQMKFLWCAPAAWGLVLMAAIGAPWYIGMTRHYGDVFTHEFFVNDHVRRLFEAEHKKNDTWFFYPASMVLCMFPWSFFVASTLFSLPGRVRRKAVSPMTGFLICWVVVVFVVFQSAHSKLTSYIVPMFPALALLTADFIGESMAVRPRRFKALLGATWGTLFLVPIGILVMAGRYPEYIPSASLFRDFLILYIFVLALMLVALIKNKPWTSLFLASIQVPLLILFAFSSHKSYESFVTSRYSAEYLVKNYPVANKVLCAKFLARGVRFFTDKEVAVLSINDSNYFSPHPIPFLNSDDKVADFLKSQAVTYAIVDKESRHDLERIAGSIGFRADVLKIFGSDTVLEVRPK